VLTSNELRLFALNDGRYDTTQFSDDTRTVLSVSEDYHRRFCSAESLDPLERGNGIVDALKKLRTRHDKASTASLRNLKFCASESEPDAKSMFFLPPREQLMKQSHEVLRSELANAETLLARLQHAQAHPNNRWR
jgi:hypothetical protein